MSVPHDKVAAPKALTGAEKLEKLLQEFQDSAKTATTDPGKNLREWLDKSPDLKKRMEDAADKGNLVKIEPLAAGANAGGSYSANTKTMSLPVDKLNTPSQQAEIIFVLGHEIEHAGYGAKRTAALATFFKDVDDLAKTNSPKHDHTEGVGKVVQFYRENEANAHIGGFNAIVSKLTKDTGAAPELKDIYQAHPGRMQDFIDKTGVSPNFTYALKPGLTLEADKTMTQNKGNLDAMGKYYFDGGSASLGKNGNQTYPNYYGDWAMGVVETKEKAAHATRKIADPTAVAPEIELNTTKLGLSKAVLTNTLIYTDVNPIKREREEPKPSTPTPATPTPVTPNATPSGGQDDSSKRQRTGGKDTDEPIVPLSEQRSLTLYTQAESALSKLGPDSRITSAQEFSNVAAQMALQAHKDGLTEINGALKGPYGNLIAYQGNPTSEFVKPSSIDVATVKMEPASKSIEALDQLLSAQKIESPTNKAEIGAFQR
jgi:hypothetical protein